MTPHTLSLCDQLNRHNARCLRAVRGRGAGRAGPAVRLGGAGGPLRALRPRGAAAVQAAAAGLRREAAGARLRLLPDLRPRAGPGVWSVHGPLRLRPELPAAARGEAAAAGAAGGTGGVRQRRRQKAQQHPHTGTETR